MERGAELYKTTRISFPLHFFGFMLIFCLMGLNQSTALYLYFLPISFLILRLKNGSEWIPIFSLTKILCSNLTNVKIYD